MLKTEPTAGPGPDFPATSIPLILGTTNRHKGEEMAAMIVPTWKADHHLARLAIQTLDDHPTLPEVVEDADTFAGNARKKASETAQSLGLWVLADDSGLAVDALKGAPGVFSARYAGEPGNDAANNAKLLEAMSEIPDTRRTAVFRCHLAVSDPTGAIRVEAKGMCRGWITREHRGSNGFGYDSLFLVLEYHKTFGELGPIVKRHLSHRARAFEQLRPKLIQLIASGAMPGGMAHQVVDETPAQFDQG